MNDVHVSEIDKLHARHIPTRLKQVQRDRSQREWSKQLHIPQPVLSRYLAGRTPTVTFLIHLARQENVNLNWLMAGEGEVYR